MMRVRHAVLAAATMMVMATPAAAQVLDATYRGTMLCDKLPFTNDRMREAIEVTIAGGTARYSHVVRLSKVDVEATTEQGAGTVEGQKISLQGGWKGGNRSYEAKYSGSFVRRSATLRGTQTWTARRQDRHPCLHRRDQAPAETVPAARPEAGGGLSGTVSPLLPNRACASVADGSSPKLAR